MAHKAIPGGYESMAGDINGVLGTLPSDKAELVRKSVLGAYTRLPDLSTRSGNMLHYMVCHQVTPNPNFDPTSLFFKIGETVLRLSRVDFALVSGLKFGPSSFDPYAAHILPPNSVYERLFGAKEETFTSDVRTAYINKEFVVNRVKVHASKDDLVKLSKLLITCGFVMGFDGTKKKIPQWLWVLLEDDDKWEAFPWGSVSFQYLMKEVNAIAKSRKGKKKLNYTFKGNAIAFSVSLLQHLFVFIF